jgi:hypothetical protein
LGKVHAGNGFASEVRRVDDDQITVIAHRVVDVGHIPAGPFPDVLEDPGNSEREVNGVKAKD